jgi:hypothetical protein
MAGQVARIAKILIFLNVLLEPSEELLLDSFKSYSKTILQEKDAVCINIKRIPVISRLLEYYATRKYIGRLKSVIHNIFVTAFFYLTLFLCQGITAIFKFQSQFSSN